MTVYVMLLLRTTYQQPQIVQSAIRILDHDSTLYYLTTLLHQLLKQPSTTTSAYFSKQHQKKERFCAENRKLNKDFLENLESFMIYIF